MGGLLKKQKNGVFWETHPHMIAPGYAVPLCGRLLPGCSPKKILLFNHCFSHLPRDARGLAGCTTHYHPAAALKTHFSPETQLASWPELLRRA